ncbi:uncharacterized protein MKK02DRAFT_44268 [Dioszegia hungarica]|uniref:Uncharacterized protein n=1 Tax=Dioszegia hungarica TaxID=4972 RepID=A0AA38LUI4_9TREE|nr:uncharacterized protein MKK02DRAFT_44268 [Dioszegia hungarica]KAI9635578.1 hypothetical protein MKK02DRAFT_44268 [Dioszegia hungarica]
MAQGAGKKSGGKSVSGGAAKKKSGVTRPGRFVVPPKTVGKIVAKAQEKKLSSKINDSIEKQMVQAASSGKLTIMKGKTDLRPGEGKSKAGGAKPPKPEKIARKNLNHHTRSG